MNENITHEKRISGIFFSKGRGGGGGAFIIIITNTNI
jgi:hypothetical protein